MPPPGRRRPRERAREYLGDPGRAFEVGVQLVARRQLQHLVVRVDHREAEANGVQQAALRLWHEQRRMSNGTMEYNRQRSACDANGTWQLCNNKEPNEMMPRLTGRGKRVPQLTAAALRMLIRWELRWQHGQIKQTGPNAAGSRIQRAWQRSAEI